MNHIATRSQVDAWIDAEDANVFQVKQLVSKWMVSQAEVPADSSASHATGRVNECLGHYKEISRGNVEEKEVKYKDTGNKGQKIEGTKTLVSEGQEAYSDKCLFKGLPRIKDRKAMCRSRSSEKGEGNRPSCIKKRR